MRRERRLGITTTTATSTPTTVYPVTPAHEGSFRRGALRSRELPLFARLGSGGQLYLSRFERQQQRRKQKATDEAQVPHTCWQGLYSRRCRQHGRSANQWMLRFPPVINEGVSGGNQPTRVPGIILSYYGRGKQSFLSCERVAIETMITLIIEVLV